MPRGARHRREPFGELIDLHCDCDDFAARTLDEAASHMIRTHHATEGSLFIRSGLTFTPQPLEADECEDLTEEGREFMARSKKLVVRSTPACLISFVLVSCSMTVRSCVQTWDKTTHLLFRVEADDGREMHLKTRTKVLDEEEENEKQRSIWICPHGQCGCM